MPSPAFTITGNLQTIFGTADTGSVTITLANYGSAVPRVVGTSILASISTTVQAAGGTFTATVWGNDVIAPAGTFYELEFKSDTGSSTQKVAYQFNGSGTFDISSLTPLTVPGATLYFSNGIFTANSGGLVPASGGGTANFLRADGTFALPGGGFTSFTPISHQFLTGVNGSGIFSAAQPAASDLSNGVTGSGVVVLATSPALVTPNIGAASGSSLTVSGQLQSNQGGGGSSSGLFVAANNAGLAVSNLLASTDNKVWDVVTSGAGLFYRVVNDANNNAVAYLQVNRSGTSITAMTLWNMTVPSATDTIVGRATTDILTNKTYDTAGTGNVFKINGTQITAVSGTGAAALVNSPSFTTPSIDVATGTSLTLSGNLSAGGFVHQSVSNTNVTAVTNTGTTSQTALQAVSTASAELNTIGRWVTVRARGFHSTGATGGTITYTLKIGSTTLITIGSFNLANSLPNNAWYVEIDVMVQTAGASGALEVQANALLNNTASAAFFNSATISGIDLTGTVTFTLYSTASQTTTSTTSRMMGYQRNN